MTDSLAKGRTTTCRGYAVRQRRLNKPVPPPVPVGTAAGEATANAAAATVQAGMETGKAASEIAVGTAAGGPWGAVLSAAWSLRHTLFKVLVFLCLFLLFIIITVVSLPSIVFNNIFHTDPTTVDPNGPTEMTAIFDDLSATVADCIQAGYDAALAEVDEIIADGGYDYDLVPWRHWSIMP